MKRLLALLILSLSFCCAPATKQSPPPDPKEQTWRDDDTRYPGGADEYPADSHATTRFARPPSDSPAVDDSRPRETGRADTGPPPITRSPRFDAGDAGEESRQAEPPASASADKAKKESAPEALGQPSDSAGSRGSGRGVMSERRSIPRPQPEERPGLGTNWGESRYSSVTEVPFERDGSRPSYTATLHYNDRRGAEALAGRDYSYGASATVGLGSALSLSLRDDVGNILSAQRGGGRTVAVGEHGQRYTIVVHNNTNERFEVVLSVDGLDVLDGREASYGKRGYLIEAYGTIEVEGFRQSEDAVAAFRFGSVRDSYAARTGSARNVGVIGAAAFGERGYMARLRAYRERVYVQRVDYREIDRRREADPFPGKYATPPLHLAR